jgi:hypothetical protein
MAVLTAGGKDLTDGGSQLQTRLSLFSLLAKVVHYIHDISRSLARKVQHPVGKVASHFNRPRYRDIPSSIDSTRSTRLALDAPPAAMSCFIIVAMPLLVTRTPVSECVDTDVNHTENKRGCARKHDYRLD